MYRTKKEEEKYRKLYFEDLMGELSERVNKLEKKELKVKTKSKKEVRVLDTFENLFGEKKINVMNQDYINKMDELIDELYDSVKSDMMNQNNVLYDNDLRMMKKMFTLGQIDILSRISTQQQLRRL